MANNSDRFVDAVSNFETIVIINKLVAYAIIIAGLLSVVFIFIGGISFIMSGGQEDKIKQAVGTIRYSIIGLIVTFMAVLIVGLIGQPLGLNIIQYINYAEIIESIQNVLSSSNGSSGNLSLD